MNRSDSAHEFILTHARGKITGSELRTHCPNHSNADGIDTHPSFSYNLEKQVGRCMSCGFSGGAQKIATAMGWLEERRPDRNHPKTAWSRTIDTTYDYRDEEGKLLFQVVRYRPKDFRVRRPDGKGGWIWNLNSVRRVPYHLPELLSADPDRWAYVVEGENATDRLREEGLVATTNPGGAGMWHDEFAQYFKARKVAILPDNDLTGRMHGRKTALRLQESTKEVKIIELPGLPDRGDVVDWLDGRGTRQTLESLVEEAPTFEADAPEGAPGDRGTPKVQDQFPSLATQLVDLVAGRCVLLFHDQNQEAYAAIHRDGRLVLRTSSRRFHQWLARLAWTELGVAPTGQTIRAAVRVLEGKGLFEGQQHDLSVRVAWHQGRLWYDLGDGRAVWVGRSGWQIDDRPPILFKRLPHQLAQVEPIDNGPVEQLLSFVNLRRGEDTSVGDCLLLIVLAVTALLPGFPHPVLILHGVQGSGKTTLMKLLKTLIDPSRVTVMSMPDNLREFVQISSHHLVLFLDNVSRLPGWLSDALCRASTGEGLSKRRLYTDDDDVIYSYKRVVGLNGINQAATKPDLLDRALILELDRLEGFESDAGASGRGGARCKSSGASHPGLHGGARWVAGKPNATPA